jgi:hypothetical protein
MAYLGEYDEVSGAFRRDISLGTFDGIDSILDEAEKQRTDDSPHLIVADMLGVDTGDEPCSQCEHNAGMIQTWIYKFE